jgi:5-methylcytosine-specific restriction enzyme subunit McrC
MTTSDISLHLKEWESLSASDPGSRLADVFLEDNDEVKNVARVMSKTGRLSILELREGLFIEASSYVGRITLGNIQITIHPKITGAPFIHLLRYAYDLRDLTLMNEAGYNVEDQAFQDLLIHQLVAEVSELVARGLHRKYVRTDHHLASPRGRIDIQKIANQGGIVQETLPCTYHPRLEDCLINQVLLQGLHVAAHLTNDRTLRIQLYRLVSFFQDAISPIKLDHNVLKRLHREMDRLTAAYRPAITIIGMLLEAEGISLDGDQLGIRLPGFLFDMNLFFQALLSRFLKENLQGYDIRDQYKIKGMMSYDPNHNPHKRRAPEPRPDYVITRQSKVTFPRFGRVAKAEIYSNKSGKGSAWQKFKKSIRENSKSRRCSWRRRVAGLSHRLPENWASPIRGFINGEKNWLTMARKPFQGGAIKLRSKRRIVASNVNWKECNRSAIS